MAPPEDSVTGTVQRSNGSDARLVDGHAYLYEGQGGAVRIILTDFAVDCGGVVRYPSGTGSAQIK
ncbi:MAG: hypothetical protein ACI9MC_001245 [Kiritimatiellia bacterium]|jgi:hypothetical protein